MAGRRQSQYATINVGDQDWNGYDPDVMKPPPRGMPKAHQERVIVEAHGPFSDASEDSFGTNPANRDRDIGGEGREPPKMVAYVSSNKVHNLTDELVQLEERCGWLENRNQWLTKKMILHQRSFIEKSLMGCLRMLKQRCFEVWREQMNEMRLERNLEEQTASLDQCQQVAKELGMVLAVEQEGRKNTDQAHRATQEDVRAKQESIEQLQHQFEDQRQRIQIMEQRLRLAEGFLTRARGDAMQVVGESDNYEKKKRELAAAYQRPGRKHLEDFTDLGHSAKVRDIAHSTVQQMSNLLPRGQSPERELPGGRLRLGTEEQLKPKLAQREREDTAPTWLLPHRANAAGNSPPGGYDDTGSHSPLSPEQARRRPVLQARPPTRSYGGRPEESSDAPPAYPPAQPWQYSEPVASPSSMPRDFPPGVTSAPPNTYEPMTGSGSFAVARPPVVSASQPPMHMVPAGLVTTGAPRPMPPRGASPLPTHAGSAPGFASISQQQAVASAAFDAMDRNHDGVITRAEFNSMNRQAVPAPTALPQTGGYMPHSQEDIINAPPEPWWRVRRAGPGGQVMVAPPS